MVLQYHDLTNVPTAKIQRRSLDPYCSNGLQSVDISTKKYENRRFGTYEKQDRDNRCRACGSRPFSQQRLSTSIGALGEDVACYGAVGLFGRLTASWLFW